MAPASRHLRPVLLVGLIAALGLTGCGLDVTGPNPTPDLTATPTATASPAPTTATAVADPATSTSTPAAPVYPATAKAYAEAVLAAWKQKQIAKLGDLTTALVQDQIISIPGPPNQDWAYQRCDSAAGSTYCVFINADGDVITLRLTNTLLGKAHAATEVKLNQTEYSSDAKQYVQAFVEAWRNGNTRRMLALSSQSAVDFFNHYVPPETYQVCTRYIAPNWRVRIYNSDGLNYRVLIADSARGKPHAITDPIIGQLPPECS
jgi:hypothetical protein